MTKTSSTNILEKAVHVFAESGHQGFSIRKLAKRIPISPSVIYHYFEDEDTLLKAMFDMLNTSLGKKRASLTPVTTAKEMLKQRIEFQFDNQEAIVAVLKYYLAHRQTFPKFNAGFLPNKSTNHIKEVLEFGVKTGEFSIKNIEDDAKVIAHSINGYLLEYYPYTMSSAEKNKLVSLIYNFFIRALQHK